MKACIAKPVDLYSRDISIGLCRTLTNFIRNSPRFAVKFVMCMCCKLVQPVAQVCANKECSAVFGR
jgi:hypothetical protein